jgi:hypothetical protein
MNKELHGCWKVVVNNVLKKRDIDTSCCEVCNNHEVEFLSSKFGKSFLSCKLIHRSKYIGHCKSSSICDLIEKFDMVSGCSKDDCLLSRFLVQDQVLHDKQERRYFLIRTSDKELQLQII